MDMIGRIRRLQPGQEVRVRDRQTDLPLQFGGQGAVCRDQGRGIERRLFVGNGRHPGATRRRRPVGGDAGVRAAVVRAG
jgi:hypothetical protein